MLSVRKCTEGSVQADVISFCSEGLLPAEASQGLSCDWSDARFTPISVICGIAAIQLAGKNAQTPQTIKPPQTKLKTYLSRIDYFDAIGVEIEEPFIRHDPEGRFLSLSKIPVDELTVDINGVASELAQVVLAHINLHDSVKDYINYAFGEMLDNIVQHSAAKSPGVVAAQYYPSKQFLDICIADCGIGIAKSMGNNPRYQGLSDERLLQSAFQLNTGEWYGCQDFESGRVSGGVGLFIGAALVRAVGGDIWCVSRDAALHIDAGGTSMLSGLYYPGTFIVMRIHDTEKMLLESDIWPDGDDEVARWNIDEGGRYTEDDLLW